MRNSVINVMEMLTGTIIFGLGLIYLAYQYEALSGLTERLTEKSTEDKNVIQQYNINTMGNVTHAEIYAAIMGYREYPIMVDNNIIPAAGSDYELYFSYIKKGLYKKQYKYDENRNIEIILYSYLGE